MRNGEGRERKEVKCWTNGRRGRVGGNKDRKRGEERGVLQDGQYSQEFQAII